MNLSISQHLARIPLSKLNAAIIQCGGTPTTNKANAIVYLDDCILRGQITLTAVEAGVVGVAAPSVDVSAVLKTVSDLHATTAALAATVTRQEAEVDRKIADAKAVALAAIPKVDAGAVAGEVSRAVSRNYSDLSIPSRTSPTLISPVTWISLMIFHVHGYHCANGFFPRRNLRIADSRTCSIIGFIFKRRFCAIR